MLSTSHLVIAARKRTGVSDSDDAVSNLQYYCVTPIDVLGTPSLINVAIPLNATSQFPLTAVLPDCHRTEGGPDEGPHIVFSTFSDHVDPSHDNSLPCIRGLFQRRSRMFSDAGTLPGTSLLRHLKSDCARYVRCAGNKAGASGSGDRYCSMRMLSHGSSS